MKIARVRLEPCVLRKQDPTWRFAHGASPVTEGVIVTLGTESGVEGYGYASATPHMGATRETLIAALEHFAPLVNGRECFEIDRNHGRSGTIAVRTPSGKGGNRLRAA